MSARNVANIEVVLGASGSGKSSLLKLELLRVKPRRLMVWDPKREYGALAKATSDLADVARAVRAKTFSIAFLPLRTREAMRKQFDLFCRIADAAGQLHLIADELADVTLPGWAPEGWEMVTRAGRHAGLVIRGASQRPTDIDKTFVANASRATVFRLNAEGDVVSMSKLLGVPAEQVRMLEPLEYITRGMQSGEVSRGKLTSRDLSRLAA